MSGYPQQPFASPTAGSYGPPPPKKGWSMGCILGIIALVLGGGMLVCCGGIPLIGYFAANYALTLAEAEIKQNAVVKQHLGEVTACNIDLLATGELNKDEHMVFNVQGTKGSGVVTVHLKEQGNKVGIISGDIKLPSGETHNIVP